MIEIPQFVPSFGPEEAEALQKYMLTGAFLTEFKQTEEFERQIAFYTGSRHAVVVNNGTISLMAMLMVLGIKAGDEVIVPNFTMIATPNSVLAVGAKPVLVDVEKDSLCMDLELVKNAVTDKTKAVLFVNANGRFPTYEIEELVTFLAEKGIIFLEDAAQGLGSFYPNGKHVGTVGLMGSFSFSVPKIITTGQGGCIVTNDSEIAEKIRRLKDFGRSKGGIDIHDTVGFNFKFTDLQAVIGIAQMTKLSARVVRKREIWSRYCHKLSDYQNIKLFSHNLEFTTPWFIDLEVTNGNRDELKTHLQNVGIQTRVMYPPVHSQKAYNYLGEFPISTAIGKNGLWLPSSSQLTNLEIDRISDAIRAWKAN